MLNNKTRFKNKMHILLIVSFISVAIISFFFMSNKSYADTTDWSIPGYDGDYTSQEKVNADEPKNKYRIGIDDIVYNFTKAQGAIPAPLGYEGFPKSVCTSVNNQICHGIPSKDVVLKSGDIINVDVSTIYKGYYSDASRMFCIGEVSEEAKRLVDVTKECLELGLATIKPWSHLGDIGAAIQKHAHANGYSVVVEFVGHGVGLDFHEEPMVPHYGVAGNGVLLAPGMIFTVEPMINQGRSELYVDEDNGWTSYTKDGKLSAQWEHMVLVTEDGIEILSK